MRRIYEEYDFNNFENMANAYEEIPSDAEIDALLYGGQDKAMARHDKNLNNKMANTKSIPFGFLEEVDTELFDCFGF